MLERTAACLDPCGLRALPPPNQKPLRAARQLHTAFWQHGAVDIELTTAWHALMHGTLDHHAVPEPISADPAHRAITSAVARTPDPSKPPPLSASAFLLDFLYPTGALTLMRSRLSSVVPARPDRLRLRPRPSHVSHRLYNSSSPHQPDEPGSAPNSAALGNENPPDAVRETEDVADETLEAKQKEALLKLDNSGHAAALDQILKRSNLEDADLLWRHYKSLTETSQDTYFNSVLAFLAGTGRVVDSWKISELFHKLDETSWDNDVFVAGVSAEVNLQNDSEALSIFERALRSGVLKTTTLVDALDLLMASALRSSTTSVLENIWNLYPEMAARWDFNEIIGDLKHLAAVPGLAEKVLLFPDYIETRLNDASSPSPATESEREALLILQRILVRRALVTCTDPQVVPLLLTTKDSLAFEDYMRAPKTADRKQVSIDVYAIYRDLPGITPTHASLHRVFRAYTRLSISVAKKMAGVELLWDDWHRFHDAPSRRAYQTHLGFYAARGSKDRVYPLWIEYVERFRDDHSANIFDGQEGSDIFSHLLQVHAVNAEPEEAQRIFDDMINKFKVEPSTYSWNILLNAYVKADDYDGAIGTFDSLCLATVPDLYSFGTLMQMAGSRGDISFTVDLYRRARHVNVTPNEAMLSSLVDGYCQNDLFKEAEDVCARASAKGIVSTRMWNKLLYYNALRRDLASINKVLNTMAGRNIPYNQFTYQQLLLGLGLCRQSQHALSLLTVALKEKVFDVTPSHFQIVMGSLLRTGEPALIRRLCLLMNENNVPITEDIVFRLSQALAQYRNMPPRQQAQWNETEWLSRAMRHFFRIYGPRAGSMKGSNAAASSAPARSGQLLRSSREVYQFSTMMNIFAQMNDGVRVNELVDVYRNVFQGTSNDEGVLPISMLNAVMLSGLQDQEFDRVKSTWRLLFSTAQREARSADYKPDLPYNNRISPKYRYVLCGGLRVMQEMYLKEGNVSDLRLLIKNLLDAGFQVDSKNWNYYVQALVQMQQFKQAFTVCEKVLMPNWTGWFMARRNEAMRTKLPLETRRKGSSALYLRPTATTLYRLAQAYVELSKQAPWSSEAATLLHEVERDHIQATRAIKSMTRVYSILEDEIFGNSEFSDSIAAIEEAEDTQEGETGRSMGAENEGRRE
ncbi:hypothetical protein F4808DRAFT_358790 [Astrocystis sublimbata]|nr:hypothetical protein F4808DRAFT_358790 [Astrocystis sublimbata]